MFNEKDFRSYIKVEVALGTPAITIYEKLQKLRSNNPPGRSTVFRWYQHFASGKSSVEDNRGKGRKPTVVTDKLTASVKQIVDEDPRISLEQIAYILQSTSSSVYRCLKYKLGYTKVCARWIPHMLTEENKRQRVAFSREQLRKFDQQDKRRLDEIITGDETWIYFYEPERKQQTRAWVKKGTKGPQIVKKSKSAYKVLYTMFFNTKGVLLQKPCQKGKTITGKYYKEEILKKLVSDLKMARPNTGLRGLKLLHDNAPAHKSKLVTEYLAEQNFETLPHPPYSPDLAPCDFYLFPYLKKQLAGRRFDTAGALGSAIFQCLNHLTENDFKQAFLQWIDRLKRCVQAKGEYFE